MNVDTVQIHALFLFRIHISLLVWCFSGCGVDGYSPAFRAGSWDVSCCRRTLARVNIRNVKLGVKANTVIQHKMSLKIHPESA